MPALSPFDLAATLLVLSAVFGWLNQRFIRLPHSVGLLVLSLAASLLLVLADRVIPGRPLGRALADMLQQIDFTRVLMNGMLAFLLFAGAMSVDLGHLRARAWPVAALAIVGTVVSTAIVGALFLIVARLLGHTVPLAWALVFGAVISPTDPVAVLGMLRGIAIPPALQAEMEGEALFNDGVGVVLFTLLGGFAAAGGDIDLGAGEVARHLLVEAAGGIALGLVGGWIGTRAMHAIDDFPVEVLITLAVVTGLYALAGWVGTSGPLAVVVAGLLIGDRGPRFALSDDGRRYVTALWRLIDEVLNSVLFLLIGLELAALDVPPGTLAVALLAIPIVFAGRVGAVLVPWPVLRWMGLASLRNAPFLIWGGVRGGISIALALSLPNAAPRPLVLAATYAVVLFTLIVQGTTLPLLARATLPRPDPEGG